jgi:DNA-binding NtrC family response regulator
VLAIERHDYGEALELSERAIHVRRRLGDRLGFCRDVVNLVELRLRLGMREQAEQALRFGRQALSSGAPASRLAELALAAARVQLAHGRTLEAEREVRAALRTASQASDGDKLGQCHRLAARIALEDGLVSRAHAEVERARQLVASPFARAEVSVLEAMVARALGRPAAELAAEAVFSARESGDEELAREAHVLAAEIALGEGNERDAAEHVRSALALRDEVAQSIGPQLRDTYLSRRDLVVLSHLERVVESRTSEIVEDEPASVPLPVRAHSDATGRYVGRHPGVRALLESVRRVGRTDATVLILGESGSGKELIAEALHEASTRADGPLIKVNCAALVESLLLSELFGHEKGAFTGAGARTRGRFERASGGTLFLDEIGEVSRRTQVALLRVLEERTIERVGGTKPVPVDVRIVCATNRDLATMVERGEFREDLYYRLSGLTLEVPPLRERSSDLPCLCEALLARIARERGAAAKRIASDALDLLARHRWPGNVRELENALRAASLFADGDCIEIIDLVEHVEALRKLAAEPCSGSNAAFDVAHRTSNLPPPARCVLPSDAADAAVCVSGAAYDEIRASGVSLSELKRQIERECIAQALAETGGNITHAAAVLGMKRPRLSQLVKQYGLLEDDEGGAT